MLRMFLLLSAALLLMATTASAADSSAAGGDSSSPGMPVLLFDFEDGRIDAWRIRPGDENYTDISPSEDSYLPGNRSLCCQVTGWDSVNFEEVRLYYYPPDTLVLDADTELSWIWWIGDRDDSDGVGISLHIQPHTGEGEWRIGWASHSNHQRGPWPYDDPEERWVRHRVSLMQAGQDRAHIPPLPPFPWRLACVELFFWFPRDQELYIDDICIGPWDCHPEPPKLVKPPRPVTPPATSMLMADLDGDGRLDWIVGCDDAPPLLWLGGMGPAGTYQDASRIGLASARSLEFPYVADLDCDGIVDLVGLTDDHLRIYRGLGSGFFQEQPAPSPSNLLEHAASGLLIADLFGSGVPQLYVTRVNGLFSMDSIYVHTGQWPPAGDSMATLSFAPQAFPTLNGPVFRYGYRSDMILGDVDNDGDQDLFCTNFDLFLQDEGHLVCATQEWQLGTGTHQSGAAFGDIDNDGDLDLFVAVDIRLHAGRPEVTHEQSLLYRNDGDCFFNVSHRLDEVRTHHVQHPVFADFDLDGDLDLFCTQMGWGMTGQPGNLYLINDGRGFFHPGDPESWIVGTPSADQVACTDIDRDGDPDLMLRRRKDDRAIPVYNDVERSAIVVRVLDRHGVPHSAGAEVILLRNGTIAGYRQTGAGEMGCGWSEAYFGCPNEGPYDLIVAFPSDPEAPVVHRGVHPGQAVVVVEPAGRGLFGHLRSHVGISWRRGVHRLARVGWPLLLAGGILCGGLLGGLLYGFRHRLRLANLRAAKHAQHWPGYPSSAIGRFPGGVGGRVNEHARAALLACSILLLGLFVVALPTWPHYPAATIGRLVMTVGLIVGIPLGVAVAYLDSTRRRTLAGSRADQDDLRLRLLRAIDGFSHAQWLKYLTGIASLCSGLLEGGDSQRILPRLRQRLGSYGPVIRPQLTKIGDLLRLSDLDSMLVQTYLTDLQVIDSGIRAIAHWIPNATSSVGSTGVQRALRQLPEAMMRMDRTVQQLFRYLSRRFRADVGIELRAAVNRARETHANVDIRTRIPSSVPPVFAVQGELSNIFENLISNGIRAAISNNGLRPARLTIEVKTKGRLLLISFTDSGPGMPQDMLGKILNPVPTDPNQRGRGLPYASERLRLFDGKMDFISSSTDQGTRICITLRTLDAARCETPTKVADPPVESLPRPSQRTARPDIGGPDVSHHSDHRR